MQSHAKLCSHARTASRSLAQHVEPVGSGAKSHREALGGWKTQPATRGRDAASVGSHAILPQSYTGSARLGQ